MIHCFLSRQVCSSDMTRVQVTRVAYMQATHMQVFYQTQCFHPSLLLCLCDMSDVQR